MSNPQLYYFLTPPLPEDLPPIGSLHELPSYVLLLWISKEKFSGRLILEREKRVKHLFFSKGQLVTIRSNLIMEGIDMMLKRGFLNPQFVVQIQQEVVSGTMDEDWEDRMVMHILSKSYLEEEELKKALDLQTYEQLLNSLGWMEGKYFIKAMDSVPQRFPFHQTEIDLEDFFSKFDNFLKEKFNPFVPAKLTSDFQPSGELGSSGGGGLLVQVSSLNENGRLLLKRGRKRKSFLFKEGKIFSVSTSDPKETLEEILLKWNFLPRDIIQSVSSQARLSGTKLRTALLSQKLIGVDELTHALKLLHLERILETFSWRSGQFEWFALPKESPEDFEERTSAESSKNLRSYADTMYEIAKQFHWKNIFLLESQPLSPDQRSAISNDFLELDAKILTISITKSKNTEGSSGQTHPLYVDVEALREKSPDEFSSWQETLFKDYEKIVWFTDLETKIPVNAEVSGSFLLLHPMYLQKDYFRKNFDARKLSKLHGYFLLS